MLRSLYRQRYRNTKSWRDGPRKRQRQGLNPGVCLPLEHPAAPRVTRPLRDQDRRGWSDPCPLKTARARWLCSSRVSDSVGGINTTNVTEVFPGFIHTQNYSWKTPFFTSSQRTSSFHTFSQLWFQYICTNLRKTLILYF